MEVVPMPQFRVVPIRPGAKNFMIRALRLNPEGDLIHDETNPGGDLMLNELSATKATLASQISVLLLRPAHCPLLQYRIDG